MPILFPGRGSIAVAGRTLQLKFGRLPVPVGAVALRGYPPSLGFAKIFIPVGSVVVRGYAVGTTYPSVGRLAITGHLPSVLHYAATTGTMVADSTATGVGSRAGAALGVGVFTYIPPDPAQAVFDPRRSPELVVRTQANDAPGSLSYDISSVEPLVGQFVVADLGDGPFFEGPIVRVNRDYEGLRSQPLWHVTMVDYVFHLNSRRPFACFEDESLSDVVPQLVSDFTEDFTLDVEAGLPEVSAVFDGSQEFSECMDQLTQLAGVRWRLDGKVVRVFTEEVGNAPDEINDANLDLLRDTPITVIEDITQLRNRVFGRGASASVVANAAVGASSLQVEGLDIFESGGGEVFVKCQVLTYTGKASIVSPVDTGSAPGSGPSVSAQPHDATPTNYDLVSGGSVEGVIAWALGRVKGSVQYFVSFVRTGLGESPLETGDTITSLAHQFDTGTTAMGNAIDDMSGTFITGDGPLDPATESLEYQFAMRAADGQHLIPTFSRFGKTVVFSNPAPGKVVFEGVPATDLPHVAGWDVYRRRKSGSTAGQYFHVGSITNGDDTFTDRAPDANLVTPIPYDDSWGAEGASVGISVRVVVPVGDDDTTARKVYRAEEGGPPLLLVTVSGNDPFTYIDTKPLAGSGSAPPETQYITRHYLTGIPASGDGSIQHAILAGDAAHIWAMEQDVAAQVFLAGRTGKYGVREYDVPGLDGITTYAALRRRLQAELVLFAWPIKTVRYATLDVKSVIGRLVPFNLTHPPITGSLRILDVQVDRIHISATPTDRHLVTASTVLFTLDDLLRSLA